MVLLIVLFAVALLAQSLEEFEFRQSAKVQAKKSARDGTSKTFAIAFQLPVESSSIVCTYGLGCEQGSS